MPPCRPLLADIAPIPDVRDPRGKRHPLAAVLALACVAMLCGARSYTAVAALRTLAIGLLRLAGFTAVAPATRRLAALPWLALSLIGCSRELNDPGGIYTTVDMAGPGAMLEPIGGLPTRMGIVRPVSLVCCTPTVEPPENTPSVKGDECMSATANAALARTVYEAFNNHEFDRALESVDDAVEIEVYPQGISLHGREGFREMMQRHKAPWPDGRVEVLSQLASDDGVTNECRYHITAITCHSCSNSG